MANDVNLSSHCVLRKYVLSLLRSDAERSHEQDVIGNVANNSSSIKMFGILSGEQLLRHMFNVSGLSFIGVDNHWAFHR